MPHRLRRVIAINIRNATTKAASQQIAMLDLRSHTMVVGDNGVGKSSFMRLIPLFYGAAPDRILRGTQKSSLIGYTLPGPSSAIAFEYERQNDQDLHLVVVHAKPGVEQAEFCILPTGYQEAYFVDEQNQFVERDQFRARLEAMGVTVSPRLQLHQYRSVILNERRPTRDGQEMRLLAAKHSLGPRSLFGLDMISVAMTGERLSFRDLQNLVVDRLSDTGYEGLRGGNEKALRKSRKDIDSWLTHVRHTQRVFGEKEKVKRVRDLIVDVRKTTLELGSLRVATERSIGERVSALKDIHRALETLQEDMGRFDQESEDTRRALMQAQLEAKGAWTITKEALEDLTRQQQRFEIDGAAALSEQQDKEARFKYDHQRATEELQAMVEKADEAEEALRIRLTAIEVALTTRLQEIDGLRRSGNEEHAAALEGLEAQSDSALAAFDQQALPPRVAELEVLIFESRQQHAEQAAQSKVSDAPQAARDNLQKAEVALDEAKVNRDRQIAAVSDKRESVAKLESESKELVFLLERTENEAYAARDRHALLSEQLNPPVGSVLEALRAQPLALWEGAAKALDPALLLRRDLQPYVEAGLLNTDLERLGGAPEAAACVHVGPLTLQVATVDLPPWAQEDSAREQLRAAAVALQTAEKKLEELLSKSKSVPGKLQEAQVQLSLAEAARGTANTTVEEAAKLVEGAKRHVEVERQRVRQEHAQRARDARQEMLALEGEQSQIKQSHNLARKALETQFREQRAGLNNANSTRLTRLGEEKDSAVAAAAEDKSRAQAQHDQALAGKGVDPKLVASLKKLVEGLDVTLKAIATNKHTVLAWRAFRDNDLPRMPRVQQDEAEASERKKAADARIGRHESEVLEKRSKLTSQEANLKSSQDRDTEELKLLQRLLVELEPYREAGRVDLSEGLFVDLNPAAQQAKSALDRYASSLERVTRDVSELMRERPGAIASWLDQHEAERDRELGDKARMLPFEIASWRARTVIDWFEPSEHRAHLISLRQEMDGYLAAADAFVSEIDRFEQRVKALHSEFVGALRRTTGFRRFGALEVGISSTAGSSPAVKALRQMKDVSQSRVSSWRPNRAGDPTLPDDEEIRLIQDFKEHLPDGGVLQVNLDEQVRLSFRVTEMGKPHDIQNERDMQGLSSTGLTVLITMMFLTGFVEIVRGPDSPVGLAWVLDEVGRVSPTNMIQYLEVLEQQGITAVCAAPSVDPAIGALFDSVHLFEDDGSISRADDGMANIGAIGVLAVVTATAQDVLQ